VRMDRELASLRSLPLEDTDAFRTTTPL